MSKFRKRPVVIEAEQWLGPESKIGGVEEHRGCTDHFCTVCGGTALLSKPVFYVRTLEGPLKVSPGDWIITGIKGEKYPCKPDIFEATYEPVDP